MPWRYLPVSTPRPSGDHGSSPKPRALRRAEQLVLGRAVQQGVLDLVGHERDARLLEQRQGARALPARVVRDPDIAGPARVDRPLQGRERLGQRRLVAPRVHQPEVDVVGAEPLQGRVELAEQAVPRGVDDALARAPGDPGLGADDQVVPVELLVDDAAEELLGGAVGVAVSRVDQRPAGGQERAELVAGGLEVGAAAPGHGAEGEPRTPTARRCPFVCGACLRTLSVAPRRHRAARR